jgi:PAS domain S-box-containing protein
MNIRAEQKPNISRPIKNVHNITKRKRSEEIPRDSEIQLRRMLDNLFVFVGLLLLDGTLIEVNRAPLEAAGVSPEEVLGKKVWDTFWVNHDPEVQRQMQEDCAKAAQGEFIRHDVEIQVIGGNIITIDYIAAPVRDADGNITHVITSGTDISERKQVENRNKQLIKELKDIKSALDESAIVAITDRYGRINYVNDKFCEISKYSREELIGQDHRIINSGYHPKEFIKDLWTTLKSGKTWHGELRNRAKDNSLYWENATIVPLMGESKKPEQFIAIRYEITERKRIEHEITARKLIEEELEITRDAALESVRLKSEFLANMSHEIRTPMNGVIGMTGLLQETELSRRQQEFTRAIEMSAHSLLKIIDDILDFSKIEAGQLRLEKIDFNLREAVELPVEMLAGRAQAKGIEMALLVYSEVPAIVRGDSGRLGQILTNLIGNAVKFTQKGKVVINVRRESETKNHIVLRFEIKDTGIGISADAQKKLFYAFVQADGSTTRKYGGTGLGLAITRQLVEIKGGEIGVKSTPDKGSTFWFTARFEKQSTQSVKEQSAEAASLAGMRVLIVDNNEVTREIILHQTAAWGMTGTEAESGAQALDVLRDSAEPFDIAILDLMMPEMDGFELARAIKADPQTSNISLVLLPSFGDDNHDELVREIGIVAYLEKPVRQSQLYNCLVKVMTEKSARAIENGLPRGIKQPSLRDAKNKLKVMTSKVRILVAEDNAINREVALNQLEILGYLPDAVLNGKEAVAAFKNQKYSVILMDCQMPEMDGFEATAEIRRLENNLKHTVIIAMTANAMEGDREKCLAAGMDDYLSKPVKLETLHQILEQWIVFTDKPVRILPEGSNNHSQEETLEIVDASVLADLASLQQPGKPNLVHKLTNLFIEGTTKNLSALRNAAAEADPVAIKREAHSIKGSSGNIGARQMAALCKELEQKAHLNTEAEFLISQLERGFKKVVEVLGEMGQEDKEQ